MGDTSVDPLRIIQRHHRCVSLSKRTVRGEVRDGLKSRWTLFHRYGLALSIAGNTRLTAGLHEHFPKGPGHEPIAIRRYKEGAAGPRCRFLAPFCPTREL